VRAPARSDAVTANQCLDFYLQPQASPRPDRVEWASSQREVQPGQEGADRRSTGGRSHQEPRLRERRSGARPRAPVELAEPPGRDAGWAGVPAPVAAQAAEADQARRGPLRREGQPAEGRQARAARQSRAQHRAWCPSWRRFVEARRRPSSPCSDPGAPQPEAERTPPSRRRHRAPGSGPFDAGRQADPRGTRCRTLGSAS
jgi:hypothetical protein